jgi:hypothetical protein
MELHFTRELEARLTDSAAKQGRNVEDFAQDILARYFEEEERFVEAVKLGERRAGRKSRHAGILDCKIENDSRDHLDSRQFDQSPGHLLRGLQINVPPGCRGRSDPKNKPETQKGERGTEPPAAARKRLPQGGGTGK